MKKLKKCWKESKDSCLSVGGRHCACLFNLICYNNPMTANELRSKFLDFFKSKGHTIIPSASLIPKETDPSVLFTTAGMQQFKQYYLNPDETRDARITTSQKCIRTIDIDEVGDDTHLTFFEMLGNFSFGYPDKENSYFKKETIKYGWEFLTETFGIDKSRIYATYFKGENGVSEDKESLDILKEIDGLKEIKPQGFTDNFWSLGTENSPGGPTVEFYVDGIELWNCVFNEYILKNGKYEHSDNKGVDTGVGLERLAMIMEGKNNVYETELFQLIFSKIEELSGKIYEQDEMETKKDSGHKAGYAVRDIDGRTVGMLDEKIPKLMRIIADHLKAATFIISDGVMPSNVQRGYVLRKLIRRAIRYGKILGIENNFTKQIVKVIIEIYKEYKELENNKEKIFEELEKEEIKYKNAIAKALKNANLVFARRPKENGSFWTADEVKADNLGRLAFQLYQQDGLPLEETFEFWKSNNIDFDEEEIANVFKKELKKHQDLSRTASAGMFKGGLTDAGEETAKLHTATHLLLAALREILSVEIYQKGSNITAERLRFDFNYPQKLTPEQIKKVEDLVNEKIKENLPVEMTEMPKDEALKISKVSFDPSKYGDIVKVYKIGDPSTSSGQVFSIEVCGGPHAKSTVELGKFKIIKEEASSAGVRRIKAILT